MGEGTMEYNIKLRKTIALLIMIGLTFGFLLVFALGESIDVGVDKLSVSYVWDDGGGSRKATKTVTPGAGSIGIKINSSGISKGNYYPGTVTCTLTNGYTRAKLSFDWSTGNNIGSSSITGPGTASEAASGHYEEILNVGDTVTIWVQSRNSLRGWSEGIDVQINNIKLEEEVTKVSATFILPEFGGSYSVDGETIIAEKNSVDQSSREYHLVATPDAGYTFAGWRNAKTNEFFSDDLDCRRGFSENIRVQPVFVAENDPLFGVGVQRFFDLNDANNYAHSQSDNKTIVLLKSGALTANTTYTISSDVALVIPYNNSGEANYPAPSNSSGASVATNRYAFRTLTMPVGTTLSVSGVLNVNGQVSREFSQPTGPYGLINLGSNASIMLNNGGKLYCWGYINGDGTVVANSGANVYECFQVTGWRGGQAATQFINNRKKTPVFPVNQYYIQNVEAELQFNAGAKEYVYASVYVNKEKMDITAEFISDENASAGMFRLQPGCKLIKKYISATDRMQFEVMGDLEISTMTLAFSDATLESKDYPLPINNNFSIDIRSGTTEISADQDIALLPGAEFTVSKGATFKAASDMYVYDLAENWKGKNYAYNQELRVVGYSTYNGTRTVRTVNDLTDATIDVNGIMEIEETGRLFTTTDSTYNKGGANIFSTQGTGEIYFKSGAATEKITTYQATQSSTTIPIVGTVIITVNFHDVYCNAAWLRNGNGTYTHTAGTDAESRYYYDTVQQRWYRFRVNYQFNGKNIGYDLITTDTAERDVSNYVSDNSSLVGTVTSGTANTPTISGGTLKVTGVGSDCTINIEGVAASYTPYFVLNEHQYSVYLSYGGTEITNKVTIDKKTYYVVKSCGTMAFGTALSAPSDETMGVSKDSHNSITWFLEDVTTGAQQFMDTVPSGTTKGGPVYIYGIYNGAVAHNSYTNEYYTNLKDAIVDLPVTGSATLTMYANCGTFEDESKTASYSLSANITFNVNGKEVWGSLVNNGTLTLDLNGGSVRYITGATAGSTSYRASAAVINNGTMTIQDSKGGGVISTDAISDNSSLQNYAAAVRNQENGKLSMSGVTVSTTQTVNDASSAVLNYNGGVITSINHCSVISKMGYGITNYGGTIQTISGGTINGGDAATAGRFGIQNRNIRSGSGTDAAPFVISKLGTIDTISGLTVYVYQNGLINYATVNRITGNTSITTTGSYAIRNMAGWYYDTQITKGTPTEANNVKTTVYTFDTENFPTIKEISGNVKVTTTGKKSSYAIWNSGNIGKISGDMNGDGILITRPDGSYTLENSGYIGEISGKVTIYSSAEYVLMQNIWGSANGRQIGQTYIQKDVDKDEAYTGVGDVREYDYEYIAPVIDKIGGANSEITISGTGNVLYNFGTINTITNGVTVTARTGSNALLNGHSGGGYKTNRSVRTNMGKDALTNRFETRLEEERTYYQAKIGSIVGDVTIECKKSSALRNGGIIDSIGSGVTIKAANYALQNTGYTFSQLQNVSLRFYASEAFRTDNSEASGNYAYTATTPVITLIDGPTIQATSGSYAIENGGTIETIQNANISAKSYRAIHNASNVITDRKIYKDNTHTTTYALTELFDAFFTENATTGKYTAVAGDATPNRVDSYGAIPTITLIGAGNTISAAKQTIYNQGEITKIDSGSDAKTSIITATDQAGEGQAIFNFSALAGTKTFTDGRSGVDGDYKTPAHIGIIRNVNVTAAYRAIQNGNDGSYLNVIDEIGANTDARATGNVKDGAAVYNTSKNAQIKSITNGSYTAATADHYAVYNASTTYAITIEGGYFKGGLSSSANRDHAIYQPDETTRQTYPTGYTLSYKPNDDGYYYIAENKFTIYYRGNGSASEPVSGKEFSQTVTLPTTNVVITANQPFTRSNWTFVGWALDANTGAGNVEKLLTGSQTVTLAELGNPGAGSEVTLYAIWKPNKTYTVTVGWSGDLVYNYQPNVYEWNAQNLCYVLKTPASWAGEHSVTITNAGEANNTQFGTVKVDIGYTKNTGYDDFDMNFVFGSNTLKNAATLADKLIPGSNVTAQLKLVSEKLPTGMASGTNIKIGRVALTLTTAD